MYESFIGWRYLYRGKSSSRIAQGFALGLLVTALGAVLFFASDAAAWISGQILCVDGGTS